MQARIHPNWRRNRRNLPWRLRASGEEIMPPLQALQNLSQALTGRSTVSVLVAAEPEEDLVIQRLNLSQDLTAEFISAAKDSVPLADQEVRLRPYEAGYKPDPDELVYLDLSANAAI